MRKTLDVFLVTDKGGCFVDKNIHPTKSSADNAIRFDSALSTCVATPAKLSFDVECGSGDEYIDALNDAYKSLMKLYTLQRSGCKDLVAFKRMAARIGGILLIHNPLWTGKD